MLGSIIQFIWTSAPIMNAVFVILFLILIRIWSREKSKIKEPIEKLGIVIKDTCNTADQIEGIEIKASTDTLDAQFFGELFVAGVTSGFLIKYGW